MAIILYTAILIIIFLWLGFLFFKEIKESDRVRESKYVGPEDEPEWEEYARKLKG
jgi:hypothetical protein